jgi:transcription termination factor Rho
MSILDRSALEESPLADLHAIASELSIDGYRRLRRSELIDAILRRQGGEQEAPDEPAAESPAGDEFTDTVAEELRVHDEERPGARRRRGRRGGRSRGSGAREASAAHEETAAADEKTAAADEDTAREDGAASKEEDAPPVTAEQTAEGVVELLENGSGFLRVHAPDTSEEDVYISAAQVRRCELVSGDRVAGPLRPPRRSERFASLVRIDTINDRPAAEMADSPRFEDLAAALPSERFQLGSEDPTVKAIEWLTPFGRGSRVTIVGPARAGKTEALRRLASALGVNEDIQLSLALAGARPEEISEWGGGPLQPAAAVSLAASADAQGQAVERVVDEGRRLAARGTNVVVLIDTLDGLHPAAARRVMAAARNIVDGGSLTILATSSQPVGGETTVIALDLALTSTGRFPALDLLASGLLRPDLLVGEDGAGAIARARADALDR